ncbi:MAG: 3'-5' exonuclease, partial [Synechococcus sp.]
MRWLGEAEGGKPLKLGELRESLPQQVCDDLQRTLASGMELQQGDQWRPLHPGDLAVLVGRNREAVALQRELQRRGIPARIGRGGDLWQSPEAASLSLWLESTERQGDRRSAAALALSSVGGFLAAELSSWSPSDWGGWLQQLEQARQRYALVGPLAALEVVQAAGPGLARLRAQPNGEQRLSDRRQMAELLQQSWQDQGRPSAARLLHWLSEQQLFGGEGEDAQQRIVASESMVTLTTLHSSKGLEFPLVWCPTLWEVDGGVDVEAPFRAWDPEQQRRVLELSRRSGSSPRAERLLEARLEGWQERLRLGYVALTRAKHQLCLDWGRIKDSGASLPAWLLHPELRQHQAEQPWQAIADHINQASDLRQALQQRCDELGIQLEELDPTAPPAYRPAAKPQPLVATVVPPRRPLSSWGRWSYSRLHDQSQTISPSAREEEGFDPDRESSPEDAGSAEHPCWRELPGGASFGTLVHAILEELDFKADLTSPEVRQLVRDQVARSGLEPQLSSNLLDAIEVLLQRPLGGPLGECR